MPTLIPLAKPVAVSVHRPLLLTVLLLGSLLPLLARIVPFTTSDLRLTPPAFGKLPIRFVPNPRYQETGIQMQAQALGGTLSFLPQHIVLALPDSEPLQIQFIGAAPNSRIVGGDKLPGVVNDIRGNDPAEWHTNLATYASLTYQSLYPGIDLHYDGTVGALKGTYFVQPHVDPAVIRWRYEGVQQVQLDPASGDLQLIGPNERVLKEHAPVAWQDLGGRRVPVDVRYTVSNGTMGFALGAYDRTQPLTIDPTLAYSTFIGGLSADQAYGMTLDAQGNIYLTGSTYSDDFPVTREARGADGDLFVTKFDPTGTEILYSTLIGGQNLDDGLAVAVNSAGEAIVSVYTSSDDFPLSNPLVDTLPPFGSALLKLDPSGDLVFSTYLSHSMLDVHRNVGVDQAGNIYVTGEVGDGDIGVLKLSPDGLEVLVQKTIGGRGQDIATAIAVRADGRVYLTGKTEAYDNNFPVTLDALQTTCKKESADPEASCSRDAFLMILDANLQTRYSSFLGGSYFEEGAGIALDPQGNIAVVGTTHSADFPVEKAVQASCPDGVEVDNARHCKSWNSFATKFSPDGKKIVFSTYFSSTDWSADTVKDVAVDSAGTIYLLGWTNSRKYPVKAAAQTSLAPGICGSQLCEDAVVTAFAPDGALVYSTYLGGTNKDYPYSIAVGANGAVWITGKTWSADFPTTAGAIEPTKSVAEDVFLAKLGSAGGGTGPGNPTYTNKVYLPFTQR